MQNSCLPLLLTLLHSCHGPAHCEVAFYLWATLLLRYGHRRANLAPGCSERAANALSFSTFNVFSYFFFIYFFFFFSNNVPGKCELKICLLGLWVSSGASCLPGDPPAAGDPEQAAATPWPCPACRVLPLGNLTEVRFNLTDLPLEHGRRECQRKNCVSPTKLVYKMKGFPHHCRGKWTIYRLWFLTSQGTEMSTQNCPDRRDYLKQMG